MTTTITDIFDLPKAEDITALGFVIRLEDGSAEKKRQLVADYVLTPAVREALPTVFGKMADIQARGEDLGRFIHGSFGSGKSHFMGFVGLLLEDDAVAWSKPDADLQLLEKKHRGWVKEAKLLVVRVHMMTVNRHGWGFDRALYEAFNQAMTRHGKVGFEFLHVDGIIEEMRTEAKAYGDAFWKQLELHGVLGSREDFEAQAKGKPQFREVMAREFLRFKGRDSASAGIDPNWAEGIQRMARHAKQQGFGGLVFLVDELLLWLSEKAGPEFKAAINQLNVMVDHTDGQRAVPVHVFVAKQRNIKDFFPDMVAEDQLHEHLDHHSKRFEETRLQDVELRHICKERVLKRKPAMVAVLEQTLGELGERQKKLVQSLTMDTAYLQDVYPFHPSLIEMLIDISSLMQRERTALRLLYELLILHYPQLPLGALLPVGSAFEAIFPASGVEGSKRKEDLTAIHSLYYDRFRPALRSLREQWTNDGAGRVEQRAQVVDQLIKTALLSEISPRLRGPGGALTVEKLVRLNEADIEGETERGKMATAYQDLVALSQKVPALQLTGLGKTAVVRVVLRGANFGEILERARSKVGHPNARFKPFYEVFVEMLGLTGKKGFGDGEAKEGIVKMTWRGTKRDTFVSIRNIREAKYDDFKRQAGEELRVLIDYPWDELGHNVQEDRDRAFAVRKAEGNQHALCWLPRHLTPSELQTLGDFVACQHVLGPGQEELFGNLGQHDRQQVIEQATSMGVTMRSKLQDILRDAYMNAGECVSLWPDVATSVPNMELGANLEVFATRLLDKVYPSHPELKAEPKAAELQLVLNWMVEAHAASDRRAEVSDATARALKTLAEPLELVSLGQTHGTLRLDTRYIKDVLAQADAGKAKWASIDEKLQRFGMQTVVRNLFLAFLVQGAGFRARNAVSGEPVEVVIGTKAYVDLVLERANLLEAAQWGRARELGLELLGCTAPAHRSLGEQDAFAAALRKAAVERMKVIADVHEEVVRIAGAEVARLETLKEGKSRIGVLAGTEQDSYKVLLQLNDKWPAQMWSADAARVAVKQVSEWQTALGKLNEGLRSHLTQARQHAELGGRVRSHLDALVTLVGGAQAEHPLNAKAVGDWNTQGNDLLSQLIVVKPVKVEPDIVKPVPPIVPPVVPVTPGTFSVKVDKLKVNSGDALAEFWKDLRAKLQDISADEADIEVIVKPRDD